MKLALKLKPNLTNQTIAENRKSGVVSLRFTGRSEDPGTGGRNAPESVAALARIGTCEPLSPIKLSSSS